MNILQKLNAISMVFRAQNITIVLYFLTKFLANTMYLRTVREFKLDFQLFQIIFQIIRMVEINNKVFDMVRYEEKLNRYKADLESIRVQLSEKFKYFGKKCSAGVSIQLLPYFLKICLIFYI